MIYDTSVSVEKEKKRRENVICVFTCCQSFLLISYSLHNLQEQHQRSFWQVGGKAEGVKRNNFRQMYKCVTFMPWKGSQLHFLFTLHQPVFVL